MRIRDRVFLWKARQAAMHAGFRELSRNPDRPWPDSKFWNIRTRLFIAEQHVLELGLDDGPPRRILDIGTGCGYFPYLCQRYGHDAVGIDQESWAMGGPICDVLGVKRVVHEVQPFSPLPELGAPFDLVTALLLWFNALEAPTEPMEETWGAEEWKFFLDDVCSRLNSGGRVYLTVGNRTRDGRLNAEADSYLRSRGARIADKVIELGPF